MSYSEDEYEDEYLLSGDFEDKYNNNEQDEGEDNYTKGYNSNDYEE